MRAVLMAVASLAWATASALAQSTAGAASGPLMATRDQLERQLQEAMERGSSGATAAEAIQRRLAEGDFRQGDRIVLFVEGEEQLQDTFTVGSETQLVLPELGPVALRGLLRSELEDRLTRELARYLRTPVVRAQTMVGFTVTGSVAAPGFRLVRADGLVSDVLAAAGGGLPGARLEQMVVLRSGKTVLTEREVERAFQSGATLDDAGLQPGDQFEVPTGKSTSTLEIVRTISIVLTIPLTVYALTQIVK